MLLAKLSKLGIKNTALNWFKSYLTNRKQIVDINGTFSSEIDIVCSVLQGSSLGPILFLCFINDFPLCTALQSYLFADDTTCLASGKDLAALFNLINVELQKISNWYSINKMTINTSKTKYIIFRNKGRNLNLNGLELFYNLNEIGKPNLEENIFKLERVHLANDCIENQTYKLLGIHFDEYLSFEKHIDVLCSKLSKSLFFLRQTKNFVSSNAARMMYFSLFHSHLLYGLLIICSANKTQINRITVLQKKAVRILAGVDRLEHTEQIFNRLQILPFPKLIVETRLKFMHSITYNYCHHSFNNIFLRNQHRERGYELRNRDEYQLPMVNYESTRRMPIYAMPKEWNQLGDVRFHHNRSTFLIALKNTLFDINPDHLGNLTEL